MMVELYYALCWCLLGWPSDCTQRSILHTRAQPLCQAGWPWDAKQQAVRPWAGSADVVGHLHSMAVTGRHSHSSGRKCQEGMDRVQASFNLWTMLALH